MTKPGWKGSTLNIVMTLFLYLSGCTAIAGDPAVSLMEQWQEIMLDNTMQTYGGGYWCSQYANYPNPGRLFVSGLIYYDAGRVYYQIADATGDSRWNACAKTAIIAYRDGYLNWQPVHGRATDWEIFPKGLYMDWQRTQDPKSKQAVLDLANNAAFSQPVPTSWVPGPASIRGMSYNLEAKLYANDLGANLDYSFQLNRLKLYWAQMLWMLQNQTGTGLPASLAPDRLDVGHQYIRPFMVGVSAEALIEYWNRTRDNSVLGIIQPVLDLMWQQAYVAGPPATMLYTVPQRGGSCPWGPTGDNSDSCTSVPSPALNMLIAPAYMWVFMMTGDAMWRDRADTLWQGWIEANYRTGSLCCPAGKAFNQGAKWSPSFFAWRTPTSQSPTLTAPPPNTQNK